MKMFVATTTLKNGVSATAYFNSDYDAMVWVTAKNSNGLLESHVIDHRNVKINEFI